MLKDYLSVLKLLKRFGLYIYTGNKLDDIEFMIEEVKELYEHGLILQEDYLQALLILRKEGGSLTRK